jgi:hypothetical protein
MECGNSFPLLTGQFIGPPATRFPHANPILILNLILILDLIPIPIPNLILNPIPIHIPLPPTKAAG